MSELTRPWTSVRGSAWQRLMLAIVLIGLALPRAAAAQVTVQLAAGDACERCRLQTSIVAALSDESFDIDGFATRVFQLRDGRFLVTGERSSSLGVFSSGGRFIQAIGRRGGGPGEFEMINWVLDDGLGRLHVFDHQLARRSEYDLASLRLIRTVPTPALNEFVRLDSARMLGSGSVPSRDHAGLPLHELLMDGSVRRSFGAADISYKRGMERSLYRVLTTTAQGLLVAPLNRYAIEVWSTDLRLVRVMHRDVPWFTDSAGMAPVMHPDTHRPPPILRGISSSRTTPGSVWVNLGVPSARWRPRPSIGSGERQVVRQRSLDEIYDTKIELVDLTAGKVLFSSQIEGVLVPIPGSDLQWRYRESEMEGRRIEIIRVGLDRDAR